MDSETPDPIQRAREILDSASSVIVLTGAGISQPSGVPTFRGPGGLWRNHRPEELATAAAFRRDPLLVWDWYAWRHSVVAGCEPNEAHHSVAQFAARHPDVTLVTQNVDGLHERAAAALGPSLGTAATQRAQPLNIHGSLSRARCSNCAYETDFPAQVDLASRATLPVCPECNELLRPAVVWFGEALPSDVIARAWGAAQAAEACLVLGTSALVQPAASLASVTRAAGGRIVEVNPQETPLSAIAAVTLRDSVDIVAPAILATWQEDQPSFRSHANAEATSPDRDPGHQGTDASRR